MTKSDDLLPLSIACQSVFADTLTPATLRAEARRGRLVIYRIGRRDYTTRADIDRMVQACRVNTEAPDCSSTAQETNGSSETDIKTSAQIALAATLERLKDASRNTSQASTNRRQVRHLSSRMS